MKSLVWTKAAVGAVAACMLAAGLCACSSGGESSEGGEGADAMRASDEQVSTAMVVMQSGTSVLFVDQQTETPYFPTLPEGAVLDEQGKPMADADLAVGNIVQVTGNGIMLESYPGQYPGIYKVQVLEQGNPADADKYAEVVEAVSSEGAVDLNEVPTGSLEYRTDMAAVTSRLDAYRSDFATDSLDAGAVESAAVAAGSPFADDGTLLDGVMDARVEGPTEATVSFLPAPLSVQVSRVEMGKTDSGVPTVDLSRLDGSAQAVPSSASDAAAGAVAFTIEPGYFYFVTATFEAGAADYGFACLTPGTN